MRSLQQHLLLAIAAAVGATTTSLLAQQQNVLEIGTRSQLFVDSQAVFEARGITFTPHAARKHPNNPLVIADQPWEGWSVTAFAGTVLFDEATNRFKMWYHAPGNPEF